MIIITRRTDRTADFADYADMTGDHDEGLNRKRAQRTTTENYHAESRSSRRMERTGPRIAQKAALLFVVRASCLPS